MEGMAAEITITIWTDAPASTSVAHGLAEEAAAAVRRSTGLAAAVAASDARAIQPTDIVPAPKRRRRDPLAKAKAARKA